MIENLKGTFDKQKKVFQIEMPNGKKIEIVSSGMFDTERELLGWANHKGGNVLGYLDGSQNHQYILIYEKEMYDVEVENA